MPGDMMSTLKGLLGDDAEEKIQSVLSALGNGNSSESESAPPSSSLDNIIEKAVPSLEIMEYIGKLKGMADDMGRANDSRSRLLMSLKPYMRSTRQKSIDNAIKLLNISKFSGLLR